MTVRAKYKSWSLAAEFWTRAVLCCPVSLASCQNDSKLDYLLHNVVCSAQNKWLLTLNNAQHHYSETVLWPEAILHGITLENEAAINLF